MDMYLRAFCREFNYPTAAEDTLLAALEAMESHPAGEALRHWLAVYDEKGTATDFGDALGAVRAAGTPQGVHLYTAELLLFILSSRHLWELYQKEGVSYDLYHAAMLDLKYKLEECHTVYGVWGSFVAGWFIGFFTMERYTLGRLQYEEKILKEMHPVAAHHDDCYVVDGYALTPDSRVVNVHIPSAGPLKNEEVAASFRMATQFYAARFGDRVPFVCYSWLLYSPNREILPETSRIRQFMDFFTHAWDQPDETGEDLWRIFGTDSRDPADWPVDNSLRRAYHAFVSAGNLPGEALAFRIEDVKES